MRRLCVGLAQIAAKQGQNRLQGRANAAQLDRTRGDSYFWPLKLNLLIHVFTVNPIEVYVWLHIIPGQYVIAEI